jgi:hypothetical protein
VKTVLLQFPRACSTAVYNLFGYSTAVLDSTRKEPS